MKGFNDLLAKPGEYCAQYFFVPIDSFLFLPQLFFSKVSPEVARPSLSPDLYIDSSEVSVHHSGPQLR